MAFDHISRHSFFVSIRRISSLLHGSDLCFELRLLHWVRSFCRRPHARLNFDTDMRHRWRFICSQVRVYKRTAAQSGHSAKLQDLSASLHCSTVSLFSLDSASPTPRKSLLQISRGVRLLPFYSSSSRSLLGSPLATETIRDQFERSQSIQLEPKSTWLPLSPVSACA